MAVTGRIVRAVRRRTIEPLFRLLDQRFSGLAERIEAHTVNLARHHESINEQIVGAYNEGLNTTRALVRTEGEAVGEYVLAMARVEERITRALEARAVDALPHDPARLDDEVADYLNWALSADGLGREPGLAPERAVEVRFAAGGPVLADVRARVIDVPLVHARCGSRTGLRVLDLGGHRRTLALELASLGHDVVALDPRGYPYAHPGLEEVRATWESWRGPDQPFDVVVGLAAAVDRDLLERASKWIGPGGEIVLSVEWHGPATSPFAPTAEALSALVPGLVPVVVQRFARVGPTGWVPVEAPGTPDPGVADRLAVFTFRAA